MDIQIVNANKFKLTFHLAKNQDDHLRNIWRSIDNCKEFISKEVEYYATGLKHPSFNGVISTNFSVEKLSEKVEKVISFFTEQNLPFIWHTTSVSMPVKIADYLLENTPLKNEYDTPGMVCCINRWKPSTTIRTDIKNLKIIQAKSMEEYQLALQILEEVYGIPQVFLLKYVEKLLLQQEPTERVYFVLVGDEPVATASLFFSAGVAGVHALGTAEKWRNQGIARILMEKMMIDAQSLGYTWMTLSSTEMAFHLYESLGFEKICTGQRFYWVP